MEQQKGLMKVFSVGLTILKEWRMMGFLKGCMWESEWVVSSSTVEEID